MKFTRLWAQRVSVVSAAFLVSMSSGIFAANAGSWTDDDYLVEYVRIQNGYARLRLDESATVSLSHSCDTFGNIFIMEKATHDNFDLTVATALTALALRKTVRIYSYGCVGSPSYPTLDMLLIEGDS